MKLRNKTQPLTAAIAAALLLITIIPFATANLGGGFGTGDVDTCLDYVCVEQHGECQNLWETCEVDGTCRWLYQLGCCDPVLICDHPVCCYGPGCGPGCAPPFCGDGIQDGWEGCDDGNWDNGDGCDEICQEEICGNGIVQPHIGEECDDGNTEDGDGCSSTCQNEGTPWCGNGGTCTDDADCDDDNTDETCSPEGYCVESGEECDDANGVQGDGCDMCVLEGGGGAVCGDGVREGLEECDDGVDTDTFVTEDATDDDGACVIDDALPMYSCKNNVCGDGYWFGPLEGGSEECDDGNTNDGDGCSATCTIEPITCADIGGYCASLINGEPVPPFGSGPCFGDRQIVDRIAEADSECQSTYGNPEARCCIYQAGGFCS